MKLLPQVSHRARKRIAYSNFAMGTLVTIGLVVLIYGSLDLPYLKILEQNLICSKSGKFSLTGWAALGSVVKFFFAGIVFYPKKRAPGN